MDYVKKHNKTLNAIMILIYLHVLKLHPIQAKSVFLIRNAYMFHKRNVRKTKMLTTQ